jgi:antitoxin (DNA-binding transcriptional repressor) of toxin-antitoxin stability system
MGAQYPASWADGDEALVFGMSELDPQTAHIITEIETVGKPAFITRDGRFVAVITPLAAGQVDSRVLPVMALQIAQRGWGGHAGAMTAYAHRPSALFAQA